jgi:hypothetical protein
MSRDDIASLGLAFALVAWFFSPMLVGWWNAIIRRRESRVQNRPGFPVIPVAPKESADPQNAAAAEEPEGRDILSYAVPSRSARRSHPELAWICGVLIGLFGAGCAFFSVTGIIYLVQNWHRVDGGDILGVSMFTLIASLALAMSFRWRRSAFKEPLRR